METTFYRRLSFLFWSLALLSCCESSTLPWPYNQMASPYVVQPGYWPHNFAQQYPQYGMPQVAYHPQFPLQNWHHSRSQPHNLNSNRHAHSRQAMPAQYPRFVQTHKGFGFGRNIERAQRAQAAMRAPPVELPSAAYGNYYHVNNPQMKPVASHWIKIGNRCTTECYETGKDTKCETGCKSEMMLKAAYDQQIKQAEQQAAQALHVNQ
eukprot:GILK01002066.1.p1 GENE.GILK01002066.1~~GILK01002066.1.p1  ORF type:complete len:221 (-),score=17.02 GILK01002066.1:88-711(-)